MPVHSVVRLNSPPWDVPTVTSITGRTPSLNVHSVVCLTKCLSVALASWQCAPCVAGILMKGNAVPTDTQPRSPKGKFALSAKQKGQGCLVRTVVSISVPSAIWKNMPL